MTTSAMSTSTKNADNTVVSVRLEPDELERLHQELEAVRDDAGYDEITRSALMRRLLMEAIEAREGARDT